MNTNRPSRGKHRQLDRHAGRFAFFRNGGASSGMGTVIVPRRVPAGQSQSSTLSAPNVASVFPSAEKPPTFPVRSRSPAGSSSRFPVVGLASAASPPTGYSNPRPSGVKASRRLDCRELDASLPSGARMTHPGLPVARSHTRTVPSTLCVALRRPSGDATTASTISRWPSSDHRGLAGRGVPDIDPAVPPGGGEPLPVRAGARMDVCIPPVQRPLPGRGAGRLLAGREIPNSEVHLIGRGDQVFTVRREGVAGPVPAARQEGERPEFLPRLQIPDAERVFVVVRGILPLRREGGQSCVGGHAEHVSQSTRPRPGDARGPADRVLHGIDEREIPLPITLPRADRYTRSPEEV